MKRTKVYRPRRGLRFSDDIGNPRPLAGFVGDDSMGRTRPTKPKVNLQLRQFSSVNMSGSVMTAVISTPDIYADPTDALVLTSSYRIEGSVSFGRGYDRRKYNATLLGLPANSVDRSPWPSEAVVDAVLTGTLTSPSWTHASIGFNQAFVGMSLTSSFPETKTRNYFLSGTEALESSPVPASGNMFYSKQGTLKTIVVKHTASFSDTIPVTGNPGTFVASSFAPNTGALITLVTGTMDPRLTASLGSATSQTSSLYFPASVFINVPVSGRLVDIKVWIECIHLSGNTGDFAPLGYFGVAIRSPNVTWGHAHPIRNDRNLIAVYQSSGTDYTALQFGAGATPTPFQMLYYPPHKFYRDTFLLWEPRSFFNLASNPNAPDADGGFSSIRNPLWERDRGMRTVFNDGAPIPNPRHLLGTSVSGNFNGAPNAAVAAAPSAHGNNVPWTSDATSLAVTDPSTYVSPGSPPAGWLSGPGGTNNVNEWPTTGVNYGASYLRPLYPMLDALYQVKRVTSELPAQTGSASSQAQYRPDLWRGRRPGLRGTEISGTWEVLLVGEALSGSTYFRQARLELTYETPSWSAPIERTRSRQLARRAGPMLLCSISGTDFAFGSSAFSYQRAGWDWWISDTYTDVGQSGEIGRTFGVGLNSGSYDPTQYALIYRLTGTLASQFGFAPSWLLNNQFGMPQIPSSTASLSPPSGSSGDPFPASTSPSAPLAVLNPPLTVSAPPTLVEVAAGIRSPQTLRTLAALFASGST